MDIEIVSFGYLHGAPPAAHITLDLRSHFRDPHVSPELRYKTAYDRDVRVAVMRTPGILELVATLELAVEAFAKGPSAGTVRVAVGCAGGRHRAATVAMYLAANLGVEPEHRDLERPVVER